ncbi:MAG: carbohydrate binding family 9 domain-containing protein [Acidobacteria bacterium]|nr:carbohydrate binding family 9 domain-containing protein [Candidatus Sulfomarinibacter sp. MAG AM1]
MLKRSAAICLVLIGLCQTLATAQEAPAADEEPTTPFQIPRVDTRIDVDGVLDEAVWQRAWTMTLDYEVQPGENTPAPVRTEVLVMHDESRLYVGFRAYDPDPSAIRAHLADRDQAWTDDWVGVVLDTFNDERRDYLFVVNPLGVQMDVIEVESSGGTPWDGIWKSAGTITDWGWSTEIEIPFSTLRFQRSTGPQTWGFDAIRGYPRNVSHQMGAFARDRSNNCYLCQAHKIEGFADVSPGRNIELVPTLTASRTDLREDFPNGPMVNGDPEVELGLTARWGVTPNLTLSGTINPDFSQVEADALQLRVNRPFAIFFPELRPFFMEGADFFDTSMNIVYTRMMRDPAWGLKLTGKEGAHTMGAYVVEDDVTNLIIPGSESSSFTVLDQSNRATVLRYKFDIDNRFTIGGLMTNREGKDYLNRVGGVDGDFRITPKDRVFVQLLSSSTRYPSDVVEGFDQPEGDFDDWAAEVVYLHDTRTWEWWAAWSDIGTDFRADLGFLPQVGYEHREAGLGYTWNARDGSWYSRLNLKTKVADTKDQSGFLLFHEDVVQFTVEGPMQSHSVVRPSRAREGFNGEQFDFNRLRLHFCAKPNGHSHAWLNLHGGGQVDYANTRPGDFLNINAGFWYRFGRHFRIEPIFTRERMDVDEGWLYTSTIGQLAASWQFNPRCFVRVILQHVDDEFNPDLYSDSRGPEFQNLFSQLLFSYKLNPRTVLFVGYSDNSSATQDYGLTQADRTIFAKIGYAWVF